MDRPGTSADAEGDADTEADPREAGRRRFKRWYSKTRRDKQRFANLDSSDSSSDCSYISDSNDDEGSNDGSPKKRGRYQKFPCPKISDMSDELSAIEADMNLAVSGRESLSHHSDDGQGSNRSVLSNCSNSAPSGSNDSNSEQEINNVFQDQMHDGASLPFNAPEFREQEGPAAHTVSTPEPEHEVAAAIDENVAYDPHNAQEMFVNERSGDESQSNEEQDSDVDSEHWESALSEISDSDSDHQENENPHDNEPLYRGAQVTFRESLLAILTFIQTHHLSGVCANDLLSLIALHCGQNNLCLKTLYTFKKYFSMIGYSFINFYYFCSVCEIPLATKDTECPNRGIVEHKTSFFIDFPIVSQLQAMFLRQGFYELLHYRFNRVKKFQENIEDVYDSKIYKESVDSGFLANPNNLSFFSYFDGIALFKSSKFSLWPLYLTINELKYSQRTQKENIILAGLWFGSSKPNPNVFLEPLRQQLLTLENVGAVLDLPNGVQVNVKAKLLGAVGDLPAKAAFMRFKLYSGMYSCANCMTPGARFALQGTNTVQVFPYSRDIQLRDNNQVPEFARMALLARAVDPDASVYGVKGPSLLQAMLPNMINCMGIDVMHGVFSGAFKLLVSLWFDPQYSDSNFSVSKLVDVVDARLKNIKPPSSFQRSPRSLKTELALFKAADYKNFMFYYAVIVLLGVLPAEHWRNFCKLLSAISTLSQESISENELQVVDELLHSFVSEFQLLYGLRHMTMNIHQLLHLVSTVRNLGNVWIYSCFFYESLNGQIARLVHGTRHAALQICSSSAVFLKLPVLIDSMNDESYAKKFCQRLLNSKDKNVKILEGIDLVSQVIGVYTKCAPVPMSVQNALTNLQIVGGQYKYFYRLRIKRTIYTSENYTRSRKKLSCFVQIVQNGTRHLCKINHFIKWSSCNNDCPEVCNVCEKKFICIVTPYERQRWELHTDVGPGINLSYFNRVTPKNEYCAFSVDLIKSLCIYMEVNGHEYVAHPVNSLEVE